MDKQLACATFITIIPVLLLAGVFSSEKLPDWVGEGFLNYLAITMLVIAAGGEFFGIVGVANRTTTLEVQISETGAIATAISLFAVLMVNYWRSDPGDAKPTKDEPDAD